MHKQSACSRRNSHLVRRNSFSRQSSYQARGMFGQIVRLFFSADLYFPAGYLVLVLNLLSYLLITFLKSSMFFACSQTRDEVFSGVIMEGVIQKVRSSKIHTFWHFLTCVFMFVLTIPPRTFIFLVFFLNARNHTVVRHCWFEFSFTSYRIIMNIKSFSKRPRHLGILFGCVRQAYNNFLYSQDDHCWVASRRLYHQWYNATSTICFVLKVKGN